MENRENSDWPYSRAPQAMLAEAAKAQIPDAADHAGLTGIAAKALQLADAA